MAAKKNPKKMALLMEQENGSYSFTSVDVPILTAEQEKDVLRRRAQLHEQALATVDRYDRDGDPFILHLRKYDVVGSSISASGKREFLESRIINSLPTGVGMVTVQDRDEDVFILDTPMGRSAPSIAVTDDNWKFIVEELILRADLIVSEYLMLSPACRFELECCDRLGKLDQTVVVIPSPNMPMSLVDDEPLLQKFPRCVWPYQFAKENILKTFAVSDLIARMSQIVALPADARASLIQPGDRRRRFPVTYEGVAAGYLAEAHAIEMSDELAGKETDISWNHKFWCYFRASSVLFDMHEKGVVEMAAIIDDLTECSLKMGFLSIRAHEEEGQMIFTGDLAFARKMAITGYSLAKRNNGGGLIEAQQLMADVNAIEDAFKNPNNRVAIRPRIRSIHTVEKSVPDYEAQQELA